MSTWRITPDKTAKIDRVNKYKRGLLRWLPPWEDRRLRQIECPASIHHQRRTGTDVYRTQRHMGIRS